MKKKRRVISIYVEFLSVDITVIISPEPIVEERNRICKVFPYIAPYVDDGRTVALHTSLYDFYPGKHWMFFKTSVTISTLNHEIQHCVDVISDWFDIHDTEFRAYLFTYITEKIIGERKL